jgi:putative GTP pyrophosphokinase
MEKELLLRKYNKVLPLYERAAENTKHALEHFLKESGISFLAVSCRVKDFESFFEKISRKNYEDPFKENEDFCGVRVILYYPKDIERVDKIIQANYLIKNSENKSETLEPNEFGYRSNHFIVQIKDSWCVTPNYKNLKDLKIELQIRTILMHAWAEIEHKLGYKSKQQIPKDLQRKLFLMSAKLEDADSQFQEIKNKAEYIKEKTIKNSEKAGRFTAKELNLDSLQALQAYFFPEREPHIGMSSDLLNNIIKCGLKLEDVVVASEKVVPFVSLIEKDLFDSKSHLETTQTNILAYALEAFEAKFKSERVPSSSRKKLIQKIKTEANN